MLGVRDAPTTPEVPLRPGLGLLQVSAAGVLWGTGGLVMAELHRRAGLGPLTVSAWRMAIAAVTLACFAVATRRTAAVAATMRAYPVRAVLLGCGTALYQALYFVSVLLAGVSVSTVVALGLAPLLAAGWEHAAARSRPSSRELGVLAAALGGLVLVSAFAGRGTTVPGDRPALGLALAVGSGATYAATTVLGRTLAQRVDSAVLTTCATAAGAAVLTPFLVVAAVAGHPVLTSDVSSLALLVYLGTATMALAYGLLYAGLRTTSGSAATVATLVEPLSAAALAALLLGERMAWPGVLGGALILGAVVALRPEGVSQVAT
jgi:DME family drug/metabolite transporter